MSRPDPAVMAAAREIVAAGLSIGPRDLPCVCGAAQYLHGGRSRCGQHKPTGCRRYRADPAWRMAEAALIGDRRTVAETVREYEHHSRRRRRQRPAQGWGVGPSDAGRCRRQVQYREAPPEDLTRNPTKPGGAWIGSATHDYSEKAERALYPWMRHEFEIQVPGFDRKGRVDGYNPLTGVVDDKKSAGSNKWQRIGDDGPSEDMWSQILLYALALHLQGEFVTAVRIHAIERDKGRAEVFTRPFDVDEARAVHQELLATLDALDAGEELPRDQPGPSLSPLCAEYCPFRDYCWDLKNAEKAGRSPESWVVLGPDPDDEAIEWAGKEQAAAHKQTKAWEKREEHFKTLTAGVPNGQYGEVKVTDYDQQKSDYKAHAHILLEELRKPPEERAALDTVEYPPKNTVHVHKVTLIRAAQRSDTAQLAAAARAVARTRLRLAAVPALVPADLPQVAPELVA